MTAKLPKSILSGFIVYFIYTGLAFLSLPAEADANDRSCRLVARKQQLIAINLSENCVTTIKQDLLDFWNRQPENVRPEKLRHIEKIDNQAKRIVLTNFLPEFMANNIDKVAPEHTKELAPNCFNSVLANHHLTTPYIYDSAYKFIFGLLKGEYTFVDKPQFGDAVLFIEKSDNMTLPMSNSEFWFTDRILHAATYIYKDIVFTKNGADGLSQIPYEISTLQEVSAFPTYKKGELGNEVEIVFLRQTGERRHLNLNPEAQLFVNKSEYFLRRTISGELNLRAQMDTLLQTIDLYARGGVNCNQHRSCYYELSRKSPDIVEGVLTSLDNLWSARPGSAFVSTRNDLLRALFISADLKIDFEKKIVGRDFGQTLQRFYK